MRNLHCSLLLLLLLLTPSLTDAGPSSKRAGNQRRANQSQRDVSLTTMGQRIEQAVFVTDVSLELRTMPSSEAQSEAEFYISFPTLDVLHQYRYLTRRADPGLRLRFTLPADAREVQTRQGYNNFHWQLRGRPGDDDCVLTDCDLPYIPVEEMLTFELHDSSFVSSSFKDIDTDPLGIETARITFGLSNGEHRTFHVTNQWIPWIEFPHDYSEGNLIKKVTLTLHRQNPDDESTTSLGREFKARLWLGTSLPLATQTSDNTVLENLVYEFISDEEYREWRRTLPDSHYWSMVRDGCRAFNGWQTSATQLCDSYVSWNRPTRNSSTGAYLGLYCNTFYDQRCRYGNRLSFQNVDEQNVKIYINNLDEAVPYPRIDPVDIDSVDLLFEKVDGDRFTVAYEVGQLIPCSYASACHMETDSSTVYRNQEFTLRWEITGNPARIEHDRIEDQCPGYSGQYPDPEGAPLPPQGEVLCRPSSSPLAPSITVYSRCPDMPPSRYRIGVDYPGNGEFSQTCVPEAEWIDDERDNITDSDGCHYSLQGYDRQHGGTIRISELNTFIRRFGIDYEEWDALTPDYYYGDNRDAFRRLANAIYFMRHREWIGGRLPGIEGVEPRADFFYDFAAYAIDDIDLEHDCRPDWYGLTIPSTPVTNGFTIISKDLPLEQEPLFRAEIIFHESWHAAYIAPHVCCSTGRFCPDARCDYSLDDNGSFAAAVSWNSWIYANCANCSPILRERARHRANALLSNKFYIDPGFRL